MSLGLIRSKTLIDLVGIWQLTNGVRLYKQFRGHFRNYQRMPLMSDVSAENQFQQVKLARE